MQNKLLVSGVQLRQLQSSISSWLEHAAAVPAGEARRVTSFEVLSLAPIRGLGRRLEAMLLRRVGEPPASELNITLSLAELIALYYCLPWGDLPLQLKTVYGDVQRLLLNYDQYVTLT